MEHRPQFSIGWGSASTALIDCSSRGLASPVSGIYLTIPINPAPWTAIAWAGVLIGDDRARLGGRAAALLAALLPDVRAGVRSPLELDYLRQVERPHGLPHGRRQQSRRRTEVDVWY